MTGAEGLGASASTYFVQQSSSITPLQVSGGYSGGEGAGGTGASSATISPAGQLLSQLQQLQSANPTQFQQVTSQIANGLQDAAQQQGGNSAGQFLSNLANVFQNLANGGDLSQLQSQSPGATQSYSVSGLYQAASGFGLAQLNDLSQPNASNLQQILSAMSNQVSQALGG
jgi:hypothetical protein